MHRIEEIVRNEILTSALKKSQEKPRETQAKGKGSTDEFSFEPVLCSRASPKDGRLVDVSWAELPQLATIQEETKETNFNSDHKRGCWSRKVPKRIRRLACCMAVWRRTL